MPEEVDLFAQAGLTLPEQPRPFPERLRSVLDIDPQIWGPSPITLLAVPPPEYNGEAEGSEMIMVLMPTEWDEHPLSEDYILDVVPLRVWDAVGPDPNPKPPLPGDTLPPGLARGVVVQYPPDHRGEYLAISHTVWMYYDEIEHAAWKAHIG